jgi:UPF0755 protein
MQDKDKIIPQPIAGQPSGLKHRKKVSTKQIIFRIFAIFVAIGAGVTIGFFAWMAIQMSPIDKNSNQLIAIKIEAGASPSNIADELKKASIIKSSSAFNIYIRLTGKNSQLQAGSYRLSPAESIQQIVEHLTKGNVDQFSITFYPGATLTDNYTKDESKKYDVTTVLKRAGYSGDEIAAALSKTYDSPLFQDKPVGADLEGYIYGETYKFNVGASVEDILKATFTEFYRDIEDNNLVKLFADRGLTLYEGITLASIVQREDGNADSQKQVAQVFYSRIASGMALGSDVTYQYICDKNGVERNVNYDSPYNTRRYMGLTPGPIAVPGLSALKAVAEPADGDYLYFLAGDDKKIYFAHTEAEHEQNIVEHCQVGCATQ